MKTPNAIAGSLHPGVTRHNVSVELTEEEVVDLRMLRYQLLSYQPDPFFKCDQRREAERYLRLVDKILSAV